MQVIPVHTGSSTDPATLDHALASVSEKHSVLVILDSDHSEAHVTMDSIGGDWGSGL